MNLLTLKEEKADSDQQEQSSIQKGVIIVKRIIIYGSCYGSTRKYAEKLSELTGIDCISFDKIKDIEKYEQIVYFGGLYAGGVVGLSKTFKKISDDTDTVIITVGIADNKSSTNIENIRNSIKKQISEGQFENTKIFNLRGILDYGTMGIKHKIMMFGLYQSIKKKPYDELDEESKSIIDTYNKRVDFINFDDLEKIVEYLNV